MAKLQPQSEKRWTRNAALARYLNVSAMCLWRWQRDPRMNFPKPVRINKYAYTDLADVDQWMKERVVDLTVKQKKRAAR
jgi:predicted DNA-binding transcriptional regulator AlpA